MIQNCDCDTHSLVVRVKSSVGLLNPRLLGEVGDLALTKESK